MITDESLLEWAASGWVCEYSPKGESGQPDRFVAALRDELRARAALLDAALARVKELEAKLAEVPALVQSGDELHDAVLARCLDAEARAERAEQALLHICEHPYTSIRDMREYARSALAASRGEEKPECTIACTKRASDYDCSLQRCDCACHKSK